MALMKCPECGREISTQAKTCVGCGAGVTPPKKKSNGLAWKSLLVLFGLGFVAMVVAGSISQRAETERLAKLTPAEQAAEEAKAKAAEADAQKSAEQVKSADGKPKQSTPHDKAMQSAAMEAVELKQSMKDPKAFELISLVVSPSNAGCFTYRSTNGFGAHLQMEAVMTPAGKMILRERSPGAFATAWNKNCASGAGDDIAPYISQNHILD